MDLSQLAQTLREKFPDAGVEEKSPGIYIKKESLLAVASFLKENLSFESLHCVTGIDWKDKMEVAYNFYSFKNKFMLILKVVLSDRQNPAVESLAHLWKSADWLERETFDLFGIKFLNHPDPRRILNPDEWTDWPLRKDFDRPDFFRLPSSDGLKLG